MRARMTVLALAGLAILIALPASADQHVDEQVDDPADRVLVHGYDPEAMQLLWTSMMVDSETAESECGLTEGEYAYEVDEDAGDVTLTSDEEGAIELSGDCSLNTTDVRGPEGQVNHGTVVSNFVQALKEQGVEGGLGCYVRLIAQSDYGKGDDQVRTPDVGDEEPDVARGNVTLTVSETSCQGDDEEGNRTGPPEHAGPPEDAGRPDNAGPPAHAGPPENAGPPDHAGPGGKGKGKGR